MAYNYNFEPFGETKELAYDLRQGLAKLLGNILEDIETMMQDRDYKSWFEAEDRLFCYISMKLDDEEKDEYNKLVKNLNEEINKNPAAYLNPKIEGAEIYRKLKVILMWLLEKMEKYKMFGAKPEAELF